MKMAALPLTCGFDWHRGFRSLARPSTPLHLLEFIDGFALSTPESGDCIILPRQCPGQFVDLGLVFRSQVAGMRSISSAGRCSDRRN